MTELSIPADQVRPAKERFPFSFHGGASEFFGIWIVNLLLTIVTLGIYSAWAKVRTTRYFYGNTQVDGHGFEYHAEPMQILIGRIIVVVLFLAFNFSQLISPTIYFGLLLGFIIAIPYLINRSLRFTARMTSYRNVRFDFDGSYWRALWVFLAAPILAILGLILLGVAYVSIVEAVWSDNIAGGPSTIGFAIIPLALFFLSFVLYALIARAVQQYLADSFTYGGRPMALDVSVNPFLWAYVQGFLVTVGLFLLAGLAAYAASPLLEGIDWSKLGELEEGELPPPGLMIVFAAIYVVVLAIFAVAPVYIQTLITNITFNNLVLDQKQEFESDMNPFMMVWIVVTNVLLIIVTYGLMIPWAQVRVAKYRADHTALMAGGPLDQFTSTVAQESAIGEEVAQAFDLEIPI